MSLLYGGIQILKTKRQQKNDQKSAFPCIPARILLEYLTVGFAPLEAKHQRGIQEVDKGEENETQNIMLFFVIVTLHFFCHRVLNPTLR
jgi:hypothetical protein